ncbi:MAG: betaine-aldehyde dehydrogenase, partial [bacterium]
MADLYIDGSWVASSDGGTREIRCPADGELERLVDEATAADTGRANEAARDSFNDGRWRSVA